SQRSFILKNFPRQLSLNKEGEEEFLIHTFGSKVPTRIKCVRVQVKIRDVLDKDKDIKTVGVSDINNLDKINLTKRWRYHQRLREQFRKRFRDEYLGILVQRPLKRKLMRPIEITDIVLVGCFEPFTKNSNFDSRLELMKFPSLLKVAVVPMKNIFEVNRNENGVLEVGGIEGNLLKVLSRALSFKYEIYVGNEWGVQSKDGNWSGIIGMLHRKEVDIGFSVAITEDRWNIIQYSRAYGREDVSFIVSKPISSNANFSFLDPFEPNVWIFSTTCLIVTSIVLSAMHKTIRLFFKMFFNLLGSLMKQPVSGIKPCILLACWHFLSTVIALSYSALLLSFLTLPPNVPIIRNFKELSEVVRQDKYRCFIERGSVLKRLLRDSNQEQYRLLFESIDRNDWTLKRSDDVYQKGLGTNVAFIGYRTILNALKAMWGKEAYEVSDDVFLSTIIGIAARKDFCCVHPLNKVLARVEASHLWNKLMEDVFLKISTATESSNEYQTHGPIKYESIKDLMIILVSVLSLIDIGNAFTRQQDLYFDAKEQCCGRNESKHSKSKHIVPRGKNLGSGSLVIMVTDSRVFVELRVQALMLPKIRVQPGLMHDVEMRQSTGEGANNLSFIGDDSRTTAYDPL
ncbi:lig_chan-Glu_bd domain-containing protein, partial [Nephila pilipes]